MVGLRCKSSGLGVRRMVLLLLILGKSLSFSEAQTKIELDGLGCIFHPQHSELNGQQVENREAEGIGAR
jgi:hypothetical protein